MTREEDVGQLKDVTIPSIQDSEGRQLCAASNEAIDNYANLGNIARYNLDVLKRLSLSEDFRDIFYPDISYCNNFYEGIYLMPNALSYLYHLCLSLNLLTYREVFGKPIDWLRHFAAILQEYRKKACYTYLAEDHNGIWFRADNKEAIFLENLYSEYTEDIRRINRSDVVTEDFATVSLKPDADSSLCTVIYNTKTGYIPTDSSNIYLGVQVKSGLNMPNLYDSIKAKLCLSEVAIR